MLGVPILFALSFSLLAEPQAPPPAFGPIPPTSASVQPSAHPARHGQGTTPYSIGEPTDEEQLYVELVNRVRMDPVGEAVRLANTTDPRIRSAYQFFGVDLQKFVNDVAAGYPVAAPLAINAQLTAAARGHSQWMLVNQMQAHSQTNGLGQVTSTPGDRIVAAGYGTAGTFGFGESVFASAESVEHGHAGFEVDWGVGPGGMQNPAGHRDSNHNPLYREIGAGVSFGSNSQYLGRPPVGPQQVTLEFAYKPGSGPLVTGVAYYDLNANQRYDLGEGVGGLTVNVTGSAFHAVTAGSGGYAVPSADGARTVAFSGPGLSLTEFAVAISGSQNVKADLRLPYVPPVLSGPTNPGVGFATGYTFTAVPGATKYRANVAPLSAWTGVEGAENGVANVTAQTSPGYTPVNPGYKRTGAAAFHLAHPAPASDQWLTLSQRLMVRAGGRLVFWTRLGFATTNETALAQVSTDDGGTWTTVWSQVGNGSTLFSGIENAFSQRSLALNDFVGRMIRVRFGFTFAQGTYFPITAGASYNHYGFIFDDISLENTAILGASSEQEIAPGNSFNFTPSMVAPYVLSVRPVLGTRELPPGPSLEVNAFNQVLPVALAIQGLTSGPNGKLRLDFGVTAGTPAGFILERSPALGPPAWGAVAGATLATNAPGQYSYRFDPVDSVGFLRVRTP